MYININNHIFNIKTENTCMPYLCDCSYFSIVNLLTLSRAERMELHSYLWVVIVSCKLLKRKFHLYIAASLQIESCNYTHYGSFIYNTAYIHAHIHIPLLKINYKLVLKRVYS